MSEEDTEVQSQQPESSESTETLDDLYGEFKVQETQPPQSTQQTQVDRNDTPSYQGIPDPVTDQDGFRGWATSQYKEIAALKSEFSKTKAELQAEREAIAIEKEEREFQDVAGRIAKTAGINADDAEAGLLHKFMKDKNFQQVWRNRSSNPNAFKKVESVLSREMRGRFASKVDPQLAENQRALEEANKGVSSQKKEEQNIEDKVANMSPAEFSKFSAQIRGTSY